MIKKMLAIASTWSIASFLLFTQMYTQTNCAGPCSSAHKTNGYHNNFWADVDYLYWKIQHSPEPVPLVIQEPTSIVLGGKKIDIGGRSGVKVALGYWFGDNHCYGAQANYFLLPNRSKKYSVSSNGSPHSSLLSVPYFNVVTSAKDSIAIASPFLSIAGTAKLFLTNKMQGAELNALAIIPSCYYRSRFIALIGFRYWNFKEHLTFSTNSPFNPPHVADTYTTKDVFNTQNNFYGGQLGLAWEYNYDRLSITAQSKIALGAMCENLKINGCLLTNDYNNFETVVSYPGGYFALPTNIGNYRQTKIAVIPELNCNVGYQLVDWMQIRMGYTLMYASNVLWAGKQIDHSINPTQAVSYTGAVPPLLLGDASPKACLKTDGLWAQGLIVGIKFRF